MTFYLHEKSWVRIKEELKALDTIIVPLGALEAHGTHNPVGCCYMLAEVASREVGARTGIPVTPVIPFGVSDAYKHFPGTVTVSSDSLYNYVKDTCESLVQSGFRKIAFFSAHGGNNLSVLRELSGELRERHGVLCAVLHVWGLVEQITPSTMMDPEVRRGHAGEPETSVMLHLFPDLVDMCQAKWEPPRQLMDGFVTKSYGTHVFKGISLNLPLHAEEVASTGIMADPTKASREKGEKYYNRLLEYLIEFMQTFKKINPSLEQSTEKPQSR
jgi:creatinine amidohydrolase